MQTKILLIALSVAVFSSCSTAFKSGQTPDDVYYSPVRIDTDDQQNDNRDQAKNNNVEDNTIRMRIRDHRWREFDDDRDYRNSPYHYCTCNCNNYGYYYNPYYHPWPIYLTKLTPAPVRFTPRTVNLNAYTGYNSNAPVINPKAGNNNSGINWIKPAGQYNTSNSNSQSRHVGNSNSSRTYSPSSSNKSTSSSSSSSGSSRSESVSRPKRG